MAGLELMTLCLSPLQAIITGVHYHAPLLVSLKCLLISDSKFKANPISYNFVGSFLFCL